MGKRSSERRRARRRHPTTSGEHPAHLYDGCAICDALKLGDEFAAITAMFGQPPAGQHRLVHEDLGEGERVRLLAHGAEWVGDDDGEPVVCPVCEEVVLG